MKKGTTISPSTNIPDAAKEVGVQPGRLREWVDRSYVAVDDPAATRGGRHMLSETNLIEAKLFKHLLDRGLYRKQAADVVDEFRKQPGKNIICVSNKRNKLSYKSYEKIKDIILDDNDQDVFIVNVAKV
jgi:hypothetical protein